MNLPVTAQAVVGPRGDSPLTQHLPGGERGLWDKARSSPLDGFLAG
jgi:hypothetical protein